MIDDLVTLTEDVLAPPPSVRKATLTTAQQAAVDLIDSELTRHWETSICTRQEFSVLPLLWSTTKDRVHTLEVYARYASPKGVLDYGYHLFVGPRGAITTYRSDKRRYPLGGGRSRMTPRALKPWQIAYAY